MWAGIFYLFGVGSIYDWNQDRGDFFAVWLPVVVGRRKSVAFEEARAQACDGDDEPVCAAYANLAGNGDQRYTAFRLDASIFLGDELSGLS